MAEFATLNFAAMHYARLRKSVENKVKEIEAYHKKEEAKAQEERKKTQQTPR